MADLNLPFDLWWGLTGLAIAVVLWEWNKMATIKKQMEDLKSEMQQLHTEHQALLNQQAGEHADVMRGVTKALEDLHRGIGELTHYIRWLSRQNSGGREPPPPIISGTSQKP